MTMKLADISATASALGNQVGAGIPLDQALRRLAQMQPRLEEFWVRAAQEVSAGHPLSNALKEVWPESLVSAVVAGEQSGNLAEVFTRIEETIELQITLRGQMMQLAYPVGMGLAGLCVFLGFMIVVLPRFAKSMGSIGSGSAHGIIFQFSAWLSAVVMENYVVIAAALAGGIAFLLAWAKSDAAKVAVQELLLTLPLVRTALRDLYFGLWANYMAMMFASGIPTVAAVKLTASVVPGPMRGSLEAFERDIGVNNQPMSASADLEKLQPDDLRVLWWPFYISHAFIVAEQTGRVDSELLRVAPALIKEGSKTLSRVILIGNVIALAFAAAVMVAPIGAYYTEVFSSISSASH